MENAQNAAFAAPAAQGTDCPGLDLPPAAAKPPNGARAAGAKRRPGARSEVVSRVGGGSEAGITSDPLPAMPPGRSLVRVHHGLDFLKVSFWVKIENPSFLHLMEVRKLAIQATDTETSCAVQEHGMEWNLSRTGARFYPYRLQAGDVTLLLSRREGDGEKQNVPGVRLEIGSLTSQTDFVSTVVRAKQFLRDAGFRILREQVSEIHLAADFIGLDIKDLQLDNRHRWISKARQFAPHYKNWNFTGMSLGKGDIMLRCYDKVEELKQASHKQEVFAGLWGVKTFNEYPVTRVEYQLRRPVLREFRDIGRVDDYLRTITVDELCQGLNSIWKYCTFEWSRFCSREVDRKNEHQDRATLAEFWETVRTVVWQETIEYCRSRPEIHKDETKLRKQALGIAMSLAAFHVQDPRDFECIREYITYRLDEDLREFYTNDINEFEKRMLRKRIEARVDV